MNHEENFASLPAFFTEKDLTSETTEFDKYFFSDSTESISGGSEAGIDHIQAFWIFPVNLAAIGSVLQFSTYFFKQFNLEYVLSIYQGNLFLPHT